VSNVSVSELIALTALAVQLAQVVFDIRARRKDRDAP